MARIFLSYAHEDHAAAKRIVDALSREGLEAWWDHDIPPGRTWAQVIGQRIKAAEVVIAIWSARSVESNFVQEEAQMALDAGKLVPVRVDDVEPPVGFRRTHAANLIGWRGETDNRQWRSLVSAVRETLDAPGAAPTQPAPSPKQTPPPNRMSLFIGVGAALIGLAALATFLVTRPEPTTTENTDSTLEESMQTSPADGPLENAGESIDMATDPATVDTRAVELQFWRSCCGGSNATANDYQSYLSRYSSGEFASIARRRLAALERTAETSEVVTSVVQTAAVTPLAGTSWNGGFDVSPTGWRLDFRGDGTAQWFQNGSQGTAGRWTQAGSQFAVTLDTGIGGYQGQIVGDVITGQYDTGSSTGSFQLRRN